MDRTQGNDGQPRTAGFPQVHSTQQTATVPASGDKDSDKQTHAKLSFSPSTCAAPEAIRLGCSEAQEAGAQAKAWHRSGPSLEHDPTHHLRGACSCTPLAEETASPWGGAGVVQALGGIRGTSVSTLIPSLAPRPLPKAA